MFAGVPGWLTARIGDIKTLAKGVEAYFSAKDPWKKGSASKAMMDAMVEEQIKQIAQQEKSLEDNQRRAMDRRIRAEQDQLIVQEGDPEKAGETLKIASAIRNVPTSDELAKIGGFVGAKSKTQSLAERQVKTLEQIRRALEINGIKLRDPL